MTTSFPGKGKVAVLKTSPNTILDDIEQLMKLAQFEQALPKNNTTALKNQHILANLVSGLFYNSLATRRSNKNITKTWLP
jgi:hypothetical protein